jgi:signal transduction histidine kinase
VLLRARDEFLTTTAHELRTPITALLGYTELLKRRLNQEHMGVERMRRPIQAISDQAQRLDRLATMLLNLSWLEHSRPSIQKQVVDLGAVITSVVNGFTLLDDQYQLTLTLPAQPLLVPGDELRLEQIFYNLIQNAIKYSPAGGSITIEAFAEAEQALINITDSGIGIPDQDLPFLFDRFYRATNVPTQQISGLGIGLFIVKELVALHYGTIDVRSQPEQGTTFVVRLPLSR